MGMLQSLLFFQHELRANDQNSKLASPLNRYYNSAISRSYSA
jgi:hypothetical protein